MNHKSHLLQRMLIALTLSGSTTDCSSGSAAPAAVDGQSVQDVEFAMTGANLPACTALQDGKVWYVWSDKTFYACNGSQRRWVAIAASDHAAVVRISPAPVNDACPAGGSFIEFGLDKNNNGVLDDGEVAASGAVCNGRAGAAGPQGPQGDAGVNSLVALDSEPAGAHCVAGGVRIRTGLDLNGDSALSESETTQSQYVCNGSGGDAPGTGGTGAGGASSFGGAPETGGNGTGGLTGTGGGTEPDGGTLAWESPTLIGNGFGSDPPAMGADTAGNAQIVWKKTNGTNTELWSVWYRHDQGWTSSELVASMAQLTDFALDVTAGSDAEVIWVGRNSASNPLALHSRHYASGSGWKSETIVSTQEARFPRVIASPNGRIVVALVDASGAIIAEEPESGHVWGATTLAQYSTPLSPPNLFDLPQVALATTPSGAVFVAGTVLDATLGSRVWVRRSPTPGNWEPLTFVQSTTTPGYIPDIGMDSSGNAIALWQEWAPGTSTYWANSYTNGVGWGVAKRVSDQDADPSPLSLDLAMASNGSALASFTHWDDAAGMQQCANYYRADMGWGSRELVDPFPDKRGGIVAVTPDATGSFVAIWNVSRCGSTSCDTSELWSTTYQSNVGWAAPLLIRSVNYDTTIHCSSVRVDANGEALVVWSESSGSEVKVWFSRLHAQ